LSKGHWTRSGFPTLELVIAVEAPQPKVDVVGKIVAEEKPGHAVRDLEGVARVQPVEPHQGPE
jgi:hypothetical protein